MRKKLELYFFAPVICLYWFAAVFDPTGGLFMLRYIALAGAAACVLFSGLVWELFVPKASLRTLTIGYISFVMPAYGFLLYAIRGGYASALMDTSYAAAGLLLLLSLIYKTEELCRVGIRAMVLSLRLLVVTIYVIYAVTAYDYNSSLIWFFTERNVALVSSREYAGATLPYIYFFASPMLIYLIGYDAQECFSRFSAKRALVLGASLLALALTGTRAHIILSVCYIPLFYVLIYSRHKWLFIVSAALLIALVIGTVDFRILDAFFNAKEVSNSVKMAMLANYSDIFSNPLTFIFGQGYNASAWSHALRGMISIDVHASKTELTYIELVRVYGLVMALPFFVLFGAVIYELSRLPAEFRWLYPAFIVFLIDSAGNPYLFSTNGMLPLGLILAIVSFAETNQVRNA